MPALKILEVVGMYDWRVQWQESFEETFPNLHSLMVEVFWLDADEMYDDGEGSTQYEPKPTPGSVKWDSVLTWYRHSFFFWMEYMCDELSKLFLETAPQQARRCRLDPIQLIQWYLKSKKVFGRADIIYLKSILADDIMTILHVMKSIDLWEPLGVESLYVVLPPDTAPSVAHLLSDSIEDLNIDLPADCILDPSVIPECIRLLPKLVFLEIFLKMSIQTFQPSNRCTAATCSFRSFQDCDSLKSVSCSFTSQSKDPQWKFELLAAGSIESDPGNEVLDFEREVRQWFELNPVLEELNIYYK